MITTAFNDVFYAFLSAFQNKQYILDFALVPMSSTCMLFLSSDRNSIQVEDIGKSV